MTRSNKYTTLVLSALTFSAACGGEDTASPSDPSTRPPETEGSGGRGGDAPEPPRDALADWTYRVPIWVQSEEEAELSEHQIYIDVDSATLILDRKMRPDGGDIRIVGADGTLLPYWVESGIVSERTRIWTKLPSIPPEGTWAYLYYGNPAAETAASPHDTFDLFDDFDGDALDTSIWKIVTQDGGAVSVAGGELHLTATSGAANVAAIVGPALDGNRILGTKLTGTGSAGASTQALLLFRETSDGFFWAKEKWTDIAYGAEFQQVYGHVSSPEGTTGTGVATKHGGLLGPHTFYLERHADDITFTYNQDWVRWLNTLDQNWPAEAARYPSLSANSYDGVSGFTYGFDWFFAAKSAELAIVLTLEETL